MLLLGLLTLFLLLFLKEFGSVSLCLLPWFDLALVSDSWTSVFAVLLVVNTSSILLWSYYYIDSEPCFKYFCGSLFCFVFSMFLLIFSGTLWTAFIAWDLLGFSSLWLVVMLRSRVALLGGLVTGLTNRLGDCFFFLALSYCIFSGGLGIPVLILLCLAGMTKSALVPFSSWLPLAMCAPTPISSLVHSSTLVTAGIWLLLRALPLPLPILGHIGLITLCFGGLAALSCTDLKKIIAFSTLSHLGLMAAALGNSLKSLCFFHLICHGFTKALVFICVGSIIHSSYGTQELRCLSNLCYGHPLLLTLLSIGLCSLSGLFFMTGFYSKHFFLEMYINTLASLFSGLGLIFGLVFSVAYSSRLLLSIFWGGAPVYEYGLGMPALCRVPCLCLSVFAMLAGSSLAWLVDLSIPVPGYSEVLSGAILLPAGIGLGWVIQRVSLGPDFTPTLGLSRLSSSVLRCQVPLGLGLCSEPATLAPLSWSLGSASFLAKTASLAGYSRSLVSCGLILLLFLRL